MDERDEAAAPAEQPSPVVLRRKPKDEAPQSLEPPLRDSTAHLSSGNLGSPSKIRPTSVIASKNTRKRMEDRHVVLHDLKAYLPSNLQSKVGSEEHLSYYSVFDGHAGTDAACYAASHLHELLIASQHYPEDPVQAFTDAFLTCDADFTASSKKSGSTAVCALIRDDTIYIAWLGDSTATLVREGVTVKVMDSHKPDRPDERARVEGLGGTVIHWGAWRVNGQLAVSRAIGDGEYKPYVTAQPDITTIKRNGTEDFIIVACDGLWDTITPEEATRLVFQHLKEHQTNGGDLENLSAKLATIAKEKGSTDNITIIVVLLKPVMELICPPLVPDEAEGREAPHTHGITSTSSYVFANGDSGSGRSSTEPAQDNDPSPSQSPSVKFDGSGAADGGSGGVFSPATFGLGNGFDLSGEQFNTRPEDIRFSNGGEERISGVEKLTNGDGEEELKRQSIDKVDDLLAMLEREGGDSPSPEDEIDGGLSIDEVLARARERGDGEECGLEEEEDSDRDSSEEEDIVTEFPISNGGNSSLAEVLDLEDSRMREYEEGRRQPCEQVLVVATGPEECGMVVPPARELPSQQTPEVMSVMSCSMVAEEPLNGGEDFESTHDNAEGEVGEGLAEEVVTFGEEEGETEEVTGFMLKTPGEVEQQLATFQPEERETSVDTGEEVQPKEQEEEQVAQVPIIVSEDISGTATGEAEVIMEHISNGVSSMEPPSLLVTPATPIRHPSSEDVVNSEVASSAEASTEGGQESEIGKASEEGKKAGEGGNEEVKSKPEKPVAGGIKKTSKTAGSNPIKSSESKASKPSAKGTEAVVSKMGPGSKAGSVKSTSKTPASTVGRPPGGRGEGNKSAGPGKVSTVSKAPALGGARSKSGGPSALKGGEGETERKPGPTSRPALKSSVSAQKSEVAPGTGKPGSAGSNAGSRTRATPSSTSDVPKKTSVKPVANTASPIKSTTATSTTGRSKTTASTRPAAARPVSSTTGIASKPAPSTTRTRPASSTVAGTGTSSRAGSAASSVSTSSSLRRTPASQGPTAATKPAVKPATDGTKTGTIPKVPSVSRPRVASTTKPKSSTTTVTSTTAGGGRAATSTTSSNRGATSARPTSSTVDRGTVPARSPVKPSAAASRVAAARAAAKAAKPPPTRKTSEGKSSPTRQTSEGKASPVRKPSVLPTKEMNEEKQQNGVQPSEGGDNADPENTANANGVSPVPVKEGSNCETETDTTDSAVKEGACQNGEQTVEGGAEVMVDGEGGGIGTSEC